ncbi:4-hydroxy-tetrahydrodipicolinate synthase [Nocardia amikacinitolerans]|uniref:4-hydroxy-tetrahydrodipicolinate synthase n=1 Tax=Nocardia amikacinitolerans TaxID=756689 RepID=A0A285L289_9NOCA|nr:dihydrodipicolinate synthase family protein [Nocardia amikacinitolerans]SNY79042.1 4-hydroxy-tetrahydrodipicolinate synthase [Nocardia amikacinitolerans]
MTRAIEGIVAYPVTPFAAAGRVDTSALARLLDRMIDAGVDAIAPLGSTGESAYLDEREWQQVAAACVEHTAGRVPTVVGVSDLTTAATARRARFAERSGATAVMVLPISYWSLTRAELRAHFTAVAESTALPVMVYNNPATTGIDMPPEFLVDLVHEVENITMIKESSGDIGRMHRIVELGGGRVPFFNGSNPLALRAFAAGAAGWCTAAPCLVPERVVEFWRLLRAGETDSATALFDKLEPLLTALVSRGLPTTVKSALRSTGLDAGDPRRPLLPLEPEPARELDALVAAVNA